MNGRITVGLVQPPDACPPGLGMLLVAHGYLLAGSAADRAGGLRLARDHEPDVVVIDADLGPDSGIDLARELLADRPRRRIVLRTGVGDVDGLPRGPGPAVRGYALTGGALGGLVQAIREVAAGGTYVDPRLAWALLSQRAAASDLRSRPMPSVSARERQVMQLLAEGLTGEEVAERLVLSAETVKTHIRNAMAKLEARNRAHAVAIALGGGLISVPAPRPDAGLR